MGLTLSQNPEPKYPFKSQSIGIDIHIGLISVKLLILVYTSGVIFVMGAQGTV